MHDTVNTTVMNIVHNVVHFHKLPPVYIKICSMDLSCSIHTPKAPTHTIIDNIDYIYILSILSCSVSSEW